MRTGFTTIPGETLASLLTGPHGDVKLDALTAIIEDVEAGDLPPGSGLGRLEVASMSLEWDEFDEVYLLEVIWAAEVLEPGA